MIVPGRTEVKPACAGVRLVAITRNGHAVRDGHAGAEQRAVPDG
jgi:hypothetical protein